MRRLSDMDDRDVERLLAGQAPEDDTGLADVARFFSGLDASCAEPVDESVAAAHLAAMAQASQLLADKGEPAARPASNAHVPAEQVSELPKWRRNPVIQKLIASKWATITAIATALVLALGGTAFAGVLPTPIQDAVAGAAETVGVDLPDSHEAEDALDEAVGDIEEKDDDAVGRDLQDEVPAVAPAPQPAQPPAPAKPAPPKRKAAAVDVDDDEDENDADEADDADDDEDKDEADEADDDEEADDADDDEDDDEDKDEADEADDDDNDEAGEVDD